MTDELSQAELIAQALNERIRALLHGPGNRNRSDLFHEIATLARQAYAGRDPGYYHIDDIGGGAAFLEHPASPILLSFFLLALSRYLDETERISMRRERRTSKGLVQPKAAFRDSAPDALAKAFLVVGKQGGERGRSTDELAKMSNAFWAAWKAVPGSMKGEATHRQRDLEGQRAAFRAIHRVEHDNTDDTDRDRMKAIRRQLKQLGDL